jgi:membrane fusion protein (multidrug efflux system)
MAEEEKALASAGAESSTATDGIKGKGNKRQRAGILLLIILVVGCTYGFKWWIKGRTHIETDNAFIEAHIHTVSARVPGVVRNVAVLDNQFVKKGALLVELDPADYQVRVVNATASLNMARNETSGEHASVDAAKATVSLSTVKLEQADTDLRRGKALFAREVVAKEQLDRLETAYKVAVMEKRHAEEALRRAQAEVGLSNSGSKDAKVAQKRAQLDEASLSLSYTKIFAPADGYITRKSAEPGNNIQPGQPLMALVALDDAWVTANYKESQLTHVKPGQRVEFTVDAYPGHTFRGSVDSIMAGTGAAFSLLPPENATGNYVKVIQRIPVKIAIDKKSDPDHHLRVGMSVVPSILTSRKLGDILTDLNPFL